MAGPNARRSGGYFTPFAIVTIFAVMTVASALVVAAGQQRKAAARSKHDLTERVSLEAAVTATADALVTGGPKPLAAHAGPPVVVNGRTVDVQISAPQGKYDLNGDEPAVIVQALAAFGAPEPLQAKVALALAGKTAETSIAGFRDFSAAARLSSAEEDCLRRWVTLGRWPGPLDESGIGAAGDGAAVRSLGPGDQADIRASLAVAGGRSRVLWARLRFTGEQAEPWRAHDWRFLAFRSGEEAGCPS